jgi:uncharacterized protein YabN with tetrapyrrole methylase and pyrophosphatase domain
VLVALSVIIFSSRDDDDYEDARKFASSYSASFIDKLSSTFEDLVLIANHKIVATPTVLVLNNKKEVARMREIPNSTFMDVVLSNCNID